MKQQEVKKELKMKASKAGGKVTPVNDALSTTEQGQIVSASSSSLRSNNYLDNVIQWNVVVKRYRDLKSESPGKDNDDD